MYLVESWKKLNIQALEREMILRILIGVFLNFSVIEISSHSLQPQSFRFMRERIGFWRERQDPYNIVQLWLGSWMIVFTLSTGSREK